MCNSSSFNGSTVAVGKAELKSRLKALCATSEYSLGRVTEEEAEDPRTRETLRIEAVGDREVDGEAFSLGDAKIEWNISSHAQESFIMEGSTSASTNSVSTVNVATPGG